METPQFVDRFPQILGPFPHIFDPFPLFSKTLKISIYLNTPNRLIIFEGTHGYPGRNNKKIDFFIRNLSFSLNFVFLFARATPGTSARIKIWQRKKHTILQLQGTLNVYLMLNVIQSSVFFKSLSYVFLKSFTEYTNKTIKYSFL